MTVGKTGDGGNKVNNNFMDDAIQDLIAAQQAKKAKEKRAAGGADAVEQDGASNPYAGGGASGSHGSREYDGVNIRANLSNPYMDDISGAGQANLIGDGLGIDKPIGSLDEARQYLANIMGGDEPKTVQMRKSSEKLTADLEEINKYLNVKPGKSFLWGLVTFGGKSQASIKGKLNSLYDHAETQLKNQVGMLANLKEEMIKLENTTGRMHQDQITLGTDLNSVQQQIFKLEAVSQKYDKLMEELPEADHENRAKLKQAMHQLKIRMNRESDSSGQLKHASKRLAAGIERNEEHSKSLNNLFQEVQKSVNTMQVELNNLASIIGSVGAAQDNIQNIQSVLEATRAANKAVNLAVANVAEQSARVNGATAEAVAEMEAQDEHAIQVTRAANEIHDVERDKRIAEAVEDAISADPAKVEESRERLKAYQVQVGRALDTKNSKSGAEGVIQQRREQVQRQEKQG